MPISILSRAMMIFGRIEMTTSDREERCCGCLHVRFATIMLGCYLVISNTAFILFAPPLQPTAMSNGTFYYIPTSSDLNSQAVKVLVSLDPPSPHPLSAKVDRKYFQFEAPFSLT